MALVVEQNVAFVPIDVGLFSADGVVLESDGISHLVEQRLGLPRDASLQQSGLAYGSKS